MDDIPEGLLNLRPRSEWDGRCSRCECPVTDPIEMEFDDPDQPEPILALVCSDCATEVRALLTKLGAVVDSGP